MVRLIRLELYNFTQQLLFARSVPALFTHFPKSFVDLLCARFFFSAPLSYTSFVTFDSFSYYISIFVRHVLFGFFVSALFGFVLVRFFGSALCFVFFSHSSVLLLFFPVPAHFLSLYSQHLGRCVCARVSFMAFPFGEIVRITYAFFSKPRAFFSFPPEQSAHHPYIRYTSMARHGVTPTCTINTQNFGNV